MTRPGSRPDNAGAPDEGRRRPEGPPTNFIGVVVLLVCGTLGLFALGLYAVFSQEEIQENADPVITVTYRVTGIPAAEVASAVRVAYVGESGETETSDVGLPWEHSFAGRIGSRLSLNAENRGTQGSVRVEIVINEMVVQQAETREKNGIVGVEHEL